MAHKQLSTLLLMIVALLSYAQAKRLSQDHMFTQVTQTANSVVIQNGYVLAQFNLANPQIDVLSADFSGTAAYGSNVVTGGADPLNLQRRGVVLEVDAINSQGNVATYSSSAGASSTLSVKVLSNTTSQVSVLITGIVDNVASPIITSDWTITLNQGDRFITLQTTTTALQAAKVASVRISTYLGALSIYGYFQKGIVQVMNSNADYFASTSPLSRVYALGGGVAGFLCADFIPITSTAQVVLLNSDGSNKFFRAGVQFVLVGTYPVADQWDNGGWSKATPVSLTVNQKFSTSLKISPNNYDFPAGAISADLDIPFEHIRTVYTSIYSSPTGAIVSYILDSHIAPTIGTPTHAYTDLYNFYDPDTYFSVSAILYSGDPFLLNEARKLVELSGSNIKPSGQIPHHFIINEPTYVAISGATQTGPNLFWTAAALLYAKNTADYVWLQKWLPNIELAITFVENLYDPRVQLISAPGPLWVDVFIRGNYTTDTNAFAVHVLREAAEAELFFNNVAAATRYQTLAQNITAGINAHLWNGDHYITQLNPDGSTRDFVDYDSNFLVTAFNIAPADRRAQVIARVDKGSCTHARATYVSEIFYDSNNCYNGNTGDSAVTMGRIGWVDALTRNNTGDTSTFYNKIYEPLMQDLFKTTWLFERYTCQGTPTHNNYYIEYPELLVMLTREIVYGINLGINTISITPFSGASSFHYVIGNIDVEYSQELIVLNLPGNSEKKRVTIGSLRPSTGYYITSGNFSAKGVVDGNGVLSVGSVPVGTANAVIFTRA